jgi:hypothetical protein
VFLIAALPVADLRRFVNGEVGRLDRPTWPLPRAGSDFVRSVGQVQPRRRGGIAPWGEGEFCEATRAIRFVPPLSTTTIDLSGYPASFACAYRRLYVDGTAAARVETGLAVRGGRGRLGYGGDDVLAVIGAAMSLPVRVPHPDRDGPLRLAGEDVASLLLNRTSRHGFEPEPWWVEAGVPLALLECRPDEDLQTPAVARVLRPFGTQEVQLAHLSVVQDGSPFGVWLIRYARDANMRDVRHIRIHLLRLHCARESLKSILRAIARRKLDVAARTPASDELQIYLHNELKRLDAYRGFGVDQTEILATAYASDQLVHPGEREILLSEISRVRRNYARSISSIIEADHGEDSEVITIDNARGAVVYNDYSGASFMEFGTRKIEIANVGGDVVGVGFDNVISNSFNKIETSDASDDLKRLLRELGTALERIAADLQGAEGEALGRDYEALVAEATAASPRPGHLRAIGQQIAVALQTVVGAGAPALELVDQILKMVH